MADTPLDAAPAATSTPGETKTPSAVWLAKIAACKKLRKTLIPAWSTNVDYRRGKAVAEEDDEDRIGVSVDWSATKAKQAQLYSQTPEVRLTQSDPAFAQGVPVFAKKVNEAINKAKVGVAMDETLPDCINASGIGWTLVSYETRSVDKDMPKQGTPEELAAMQAAGQPITEIVPQVTDRRIRASRISPADALWPVEFMGSDFDDAPWLGHSGRLVWAEAKNVLRLTDADQEKVLGGDRRTSMDMLSGDGDVQRFADQDVVSYDELFYWRHLEDPLETSYDAIWRIVFVSGKTEPVIHEAWTGQQRLPDGTIGGSLKFPMCACTLTYITDECIPPSDSAMGRPQVDELMKSRAQMIQQRKHSLPIRWFDVNRVDPAIQDALMRGTWQGMVPMNGDGSRAVGEVSRANYPREDFEFNTIARQDLAECWQVAPNQSGSYSPRGVSASEAQIAQANFSTRIGYERARVVAYFVRIAKVIAGLVALYGDFTDQELQLLGDRATLAKGCEYTVRADSTVLLDAAQRLERLTNFLNLTAKSGFVDPLPIIREMAMLSGIDNTDEVVRVPAPPPPPAASISLRLTGAEDLSNPLLLAFLLKSDQAPMAADIEKAKAMLMLASMPMQGMPSPADPSAPGAPGMPPGSGGDVLPPPPGAPPLPSVPQLAGAHPNWNTPDRIDKRNDRPS